MVIENVTSAGLCKCGEHHESGSLFTKRQDVLPPNRVKSRSREIECYNDRFALKFDWHLGNVAAEVPVKFQSN